MEDIIKNISYCGTVFLLINVIVFLKSFAREGRAFKIFTFYLIAVAVTQVLTTIWVFLKTNNLGFSNIYLVSQFVLLSLFYFELIRKRIILFILVTVSLFLAYQYISDNASIYEYNSIGLSITQVLIIAYSITYLFRSIQGGSVFLMINIGIFFYLICSTLIFASGELQFQLPPKGYLLLLLLNAIFYMLFQLIIFYEWYKNYRIPVKSDLEVE